MKKQWNIACAQSAMTSFENYPCKDSWDNMVKAVSRATNKPRTVVANKLAAKYGKMFL